MLKKDSFYMPPEWEAHERTIIEWPVRDSLVWKDHYEEVCEGYAAVIRAIGQFEKATVIVDKATEAEAARLCGEAAELVVVPHNDAWSRDNGPTFVWDQAGRLHGMNWMFNAWGEKYKPYDLDNEVALRVLEHFGVPAVSVPFVLEGGSIHVDGEGTMLTTEQCLLNANRNPHLTRRQLEEELEGYLGVTRVIWLKNGLFGDETDGHVDNIACFAAPGKVLLQTCRDPGDPNYDITMENLEILRNAEDAKGRKLEIIEIRQPPARFYRDVRLTLSYLNFYLVNGGILLPVFGGDAAETDQLAENTLRDAFPGRRIVKVDGMPLIKEGGNVHCITQQMPEGKRCQV